MPRISKARLGRIGTKMSQRYGEPEDIAALLDRLACSDFEASELFATLCRTMAHHPDDEPLQVEALNRFFDRIDVVVKLNPSIVWP